MLQPDEVRPVVLTVDEASVVLGLLDLVLQDGVLSPSHGTLLHRSERRLRDRVRGAVRPLEDTEDRTTKLEELQALHEHLLEQFREAQERTRQLLRETVTLRRDAHDLAAVAEATRRLVGTSGPLAAHALDDPRLGAVRAALARLAA